MHSIRMYIHVIMSSYVIHSVMFIATYCTNKWYTVSMAGLCIATYKLTLAVVLGNPQLEYTVPLNYNFIFTRVNMHGNTINIEIIPLRGCVDHVFSWRGIHVSCIHPVPRVE